VEQKRRLPLLASNGEPAEPPRPSWQWVVFGALAIVVVWLPLAALAITAAGAAGVRNGLMALASASALSAASFAGGFLVGKWGGPRAGVREAALAGLIAGLVGVVASSIELPFGAGSVVLVLLSTVAVGLLATPAAALGGRAGVRRR
jgi:hypothetical protein